MSDTAPKTVLSANGQTSTLPQFSDAGGALQAIAPPRRIVAINVLDIIGPEQREAWLPVIFKNAKQHQIILVIPRHEIALDYMIELHLRKYFSEENWPAIQYGTDGHVLVSYDELVKPEIGILPCGRVDIFVSAAKTSRDVPHNLYLTPDLGPGMLEILLDESNYRRAKQYVERQAADAALHDACSSSDALAQMVAGLQEHDLARLKGALVQQVNTYPA